MGKNLNFADLRKKVAVKNKDVPENVIELPYRRAKATFRPMLNRELKSFLKALEKKDEYLINEALDTILENCVNSVNGEDFDNDKLSIIDRTFLLLQIRRATLGNVAKFPHMNEKISDPVEVEVDIDDFEVVYKDDAIDKLIDLMPGVRVTLGPITRNDEKQMERYIKSKGSRNSIIDRRYCSYAALVQSIEMEDEENPGEWDKVNVTYDDKVKFVSDFCGPTHSEQFDEFSKNFDFGVKMEFSFNHGTYSNEKEEINLISFFIT